MQRLESLIRPIPHFPKQGIVYRDITPLLADAPAMQQTVQALIEPFRDTPIDMVASMEARGFIFGALCAQQLNAGFVPLRKPGKLPHQTHSVSYDLEYASNTLEVHVDALGHGHRVLLVDDLIATGGTAAASCALIDRLGGTIVGCAFVIELDELQGRTHLAPYNVHTLLHF
ncbi:MAG: adenine phosphoribosyltransferase [Gammaproteobacteria bacterium]|jgi:adenine phosphoribosyltransferase